MPRQNTNPANFPQAVLQQIAQLAQNIAIARKRRGETQAQWAKKLGVSQPTFARIERGDPGVSMASYMMCMWLINPAVELASLVSPLSDHAALEREVSRVSKKRRMPEPKQAPQPAVPRGPAAIEPASFGAREPQAVYPFTDSASDPLAEARKNVAKSASKNNSTAEGLAALMLKAQDNNHD